MYFNETTIFFNGKYKGRILIFFITNKYSLIGVESELAETKENLELISERFIVVLNKSTEGIFFNTLSQKQIWFNDVLVKKLNLNGNTMSSNEFYKNIAPENLALYLFLRRARFILCNESLYSYTFFSMCMTSRLYRISSVLQ